AHQRVERRVLYHSLLLGDAELRQRGVGLVQSGAGDAQPHVRQVGDELAVRAELRVFRRNLADRRLQRLRAGGVVLRAHRRDAAVVGVVPRLRERGRRDEEDQEDALHCAAPSKRGSDTDEGSTNVTLMACSSPGRSDTVLRSGCGYFGFVSVISYVPGASSIGAGVMTGPLIATVSPLPTLRIAVTSPHGKALMPSRARATGAGCGFGGGGAFFGQKSTAPTPMAMATTAALGHGSTAA